MSLCNNSSDNKSYWIHRVDVKESAQVTTVTNHSLHSLCINVTVHLELWPGNHLIWCNATINRLRQAGLYARRPDLCDVTLSRHVTALNAFAGVKNINDGDVHNGDRLRLSLSMNLPLCSEQRDVLGIYRRHDERYATNCVTEPDRLGGGGVTVWAGIHHDGRTV